MAQEDVCFRMVSFRSESYFSTVRYRRLLSRQSVHTFPRRIGEDLEFLPRGIEEMVTHAANVVSRW